MNARSDIPIQVGGMGSKHNNESKCNQRYQETASDSVSQEIFEHCDTPGSDEDQNYVIIKVRGLSAFLHDYVS